MENKVTPRILQGFVELLPADQLAFEDMKGKIENVYKRFGFVPLDTPTLEYSEVLLAKAGGETEKQIYRFNHHDTDVSLRFDVIAFRPYRAACKVCSTALSRSFVPFQKISDIKIVQR